MAELKKVCFKCNITKSVEDFYRHKAMADGRLNKCKECAKRDSKDTRRNRIDYYREYDRKRGNRQSDGYQRQFAADHPLATKARNAVGNAVRDGRLKKPNECEECQAKGALHGHHDDYAEPLVVRWLCPACHRQWHIENGEAKNNK